jgi:hypothetical protein
MIEGTGHVDANVAALVFLACIVFGLILSGLSELAYRWLPPIGALVTICLVLIVAFPVTFGHQHKAMLIRGVCTMSVWCGTYLIGRLFLPYGGKVQLK